MTTELIAVAAGLLAGVGAGVVFFGGLRWTVERVATARRPALLAVASLAVRMAVVVGVVLPLALAGGWVPVVAALAGMLAVRTALVARARREGGG